MSVMEKGEFIRYATSREKRTPTFKNCVFAFFTGGVVCMAGQGISDLYKLWGLAEKTSATLASVTLVFFAGLFTGIGIFDKAAKVCGAGLLVPITGFSNAVTSPAIEAKSEGFIMGVGAEMFKIAGPVVVYGNLVAILYGIFYYLTLCIKG